jgi:Zn-dependent peptidase ImmA (M78 family)
LDIVRGTVLIDPGVLWERNIGCENFTIAHEVVHWDKHRLYADIKHLLYGKKFTAHRCPKPRRSWWYSDEERRNEKWTPEQWLEWQADSIASRILIPTETLPMKIAEITEDFPNALLDNQTEYYITLIDKLAVFYGTSRQVAKYRLKDIGYDAVDNIQLHEYDYSAFTHEIDEYKAYYEMCASAELRTLVSTGFFAYADNHFVINHDKCVELDGDGVPHLTDYARANIETCALKFENVRVNIKGSGKFSDILYRGKLFETFQKYRRDNNEAAFEFARELALQHSTPVQSRVDARISFRDRIQGILELSGVNSAEFQDLTLLSRDIFLKLKNPEYRPKFETVIALCAGLDLDITVTNELLAKVGYAFNGSVEHNAYMTAITHFAGKSISVRNEYLRNLDVKPLGEKDAE